VNFLSMYLQRVSRFHYVRGKGEFTMKRIFSFLLIGLTISLLISLSPSLGLAKQYLAFGIAKPGGTFYQLGAGFANIINKHVPGVSVTGEATAGSTENVNLLSAGRLDLAFSGSAYYLSAKERGIDLSNVRLISAGYDSKVHWVVRADSSIKKIRDFVGKRIAAGAVGSGTLETSKLALEVGYGITFKDVKAVFLGKQEMANGLRDRAVDVVNFFASVPVSGVLDVMSTTKIRIVPFDKDAADKIYKKYPAYPPTIIEKGSYKGIDEDILTIGTPCLFLVSAKLGEKLVYDIVKALYEHPKEKDTIMRAATEFKLKNVFRGTGNLGLPFHPGAIRYWKEKGIWKQ
jgi:TRAP transporter TAXI family solute receptor